MMGVLRFLCSWVDKMAFRYGFSDEPVAGLHCLLTVTRMRSGQLNCCVDLSAYLHFSRSHLCLYSFVSWNSASSSPLVPTASETAPMPHLRQRMRCYRGSTRGQPLRAPSSPSTESSSGHCSDYYAGRYPNTRSGRGRVVGSGHHMDFPAPRFPTASSPSPTTRTAQFSFNFSLNRPRITASVTVVFREEAQTEEECTRPAGLSSEKASQHSGLQEGSRGINVEVEPSNPGPSEGWCRIVEEPPEE